MRDPSKTAEIRKTGENEALAKEALHLAGSAVVTAGVAAVLVMIAIPISIGLGIAHNLKSPNKRD